MRTAAAMVSAVPSVSTSRRSAVHRRRHCVARAQARLLAEKAELLAEQAQALALTLGYGRQRSSRHNVARTAHRKAGCGRLERHAKALKHLHAPRSPGTNRAAARQVPAADEERKGSRRTAARVKPSESVECQPLYPPGSAEWLSADEFLSLAFSAGFDSEDVSWMDAFEAICWEHGCDPVVGISKEAFLKLVRDKFPRRQTSASESPYLNVPRAASAPSMPPRLAMLKWPAAASSPREDLWKSDFEELALELGPGTIAALGLDEEGYRWARQVFQQLGLHFAVKDSSHQGTLLPSFGLRFSGKSDSIFGSPYPLLSPPSTSFLPPMGRLQLMTPVPRHEELALQIHAESEAIVGDERRGSSALSSNSEPEDEEGYRGAVWKPAASRASETAQGRLMNGDILDDLPIDEVSICDSDEEVVPCSDHGTYYDLAWDEASS